MIYLVGGAARCGKTTLFGRLAPLIGGQAVTLDLLKPALRHFAQAQPDDPLRAAPNINDHSPQSWLEQLRVRDRVIWDGLVPYLRTAAAHGEDLLLEGQVWPDYVAELTLEHEAVFLVDTGAGQAERLAQIARGPKTSNNWQAAWPPDKLTRWAGYNEHRSREMARFATEHLYPAFDLHSSENGAGQVSSLIGHCQDQAEDYLLASQARAQDATAAVQ
jgi:hypothetical protein